MGILAGRRLAGNSGTRRLPRGRPVRWKAAEYALYLARDG